MYDTIIIGGGIVGLSTAWQLKQKSPAQNILLLEKESEVAMHQTGHNSGVIHAGVYYKPDSLKARFCREGHAATIQFCEENGIAYEQCGKLLVATNDLEFERMTALHQRCLDNGIQVEWLDAENLQQQEPNIRGLGAILVPNTGIVNYSEICRKMAQHFTEMGGDIRLDTEVLSLEETADKIRVGTNSVDYEARYLVTCAGLMADRLTRMLDYSRRLSNHSLSW